jgi:hypothetical protein
MIFDLRVQGGMNERKKGDLPLMSQQQASQSLKGYSLTTRVPVKERSKRPAVAGFTSIPTARSKDAQKSSATGIGQGVSRMKDPTRAQYRAGASCPDGTGAVDDARFELAEPQHVESSEEEDVLEAVKLSRQCDAGFEELALMSDDDNEVRAHCTCSMGCGMPCLGGLLRGMASICRSSLRGLCHLWMSAEGFSTPASERNSGMLIRRKKMNTRGRKQGSKVLSHAYASTGSTLTQLSLPAIHLTLFPAMDFVDDDYDDYGVALRHSLSDETWRACSCRTWWCHSSAET